MGSLDRWINYARARFDQALRTGHTELDELEAERESELAAKPWLRADGDTPSFDDARRRIEWQSAEAARLATERDRGGTAAVESPDSGPTSEGPGPQDTAATTSADADSTSVPPSGATNSSTTPISDPEVIAKEAELAGAKLELEARDRASAERLDAIRDELGIDSPD